MQVAVYQGLGVPQELRLELLHRALQLGVGQQRGGSGLEVRKAGKVAVRKAGGGHVRAREHDCGACGAHGRRRSVCVWGGGKPPSKLCVALCCNATNDKPNSVRSGSATQRHGEACMAMRQATAAQLHSCTAAQLRHAGGRHHTPPPTHPPTFLRQLAHGPVA